MRFRRLIFALVLVAVPAAAPRSATLPTHAPLRILIVSDEVNPHALPDSALTQPGDLSVALTAPGNGLNIDTVLEIATDDLPDATVQLQLPFGDPGAFDVLIYFAHRIPNGAGGASAQADFVAAVDSFLVDGGSVISFHHGAYLTAGKEAMLDIVGCTATGAVPWDTVDGQNVIDVAPGHFITTNGVTYGGTVAYEDAANGVSAGVYDVFNNTPDERYPNMVINGSAGTIEMLFASDYVDNGSTHVLGFIHTRPQWAGRVIVYQPGEYQPNALDDLDGNNFQILANAIYFATHADVIGVADRPTPGPALSQNYPNPFNPTTVIEYEVRTAGTVELSVFDIRGARVRTLVGRRVEPGRYAVTWRGDDDGGRPLPSGIYVYRLVQNGESESRKMILLK